MPDDDLEGGQGGSPQGAGAGSGDIDNDAYYAQTVKEPVESVPYERFKRVYDERKTYKGDSDWRKQTEPKFKESQEGLTKLQGQLKYIGERVSKHPYLKEALEELLDSQDGSLNHQKLLAAVQAEVARLTGQGGKEGPGKQLEDPRYEKLEKAIQAQQLEMQTAQINAELERGFANLPKIALAGDNAAKFEGVDVNDSDFLEDVEQQLNFDTAQGKADPNNVPGSILAAAETVAKRWQRLSSKVLGKQVEGAESRKAAGSVLPNKGPAGDAKRKVPSKATDPVGYQKYITDLARESLNESKAGK